MSCMNAFVHDLHHCTKLQLSTRCSFGVMTQTRHKFPEFSVGKVLANTSIKIPGLFPLICWLMYIASLK